MGTYDSGRASDFGGINIESRRADSINGVRFDSNRDDPSSANDVILYRGSGSSLRFWDGSSATTLGSAGGLVNYTLNDAYDDGVGITVDASAVLLAGSHATNDVLDITGSAAVTGSLINLQQSGSGKDIDGTSSLWSVTAAGVGTFASLVFASVTAASNLLLNATGAGTIGIGSVSSGTITLGAGGGSVVVTNGLTISGTADADKLTITAGDMLMSNGKIALTNDDTDTALSITGSSVTTGNVVSVTADGITTGAILYLAMSEAGITSGNGAYIECYDSTAGATQFFVSNDGATTITGNAVGTASLTLTAGDLVLSSGNVAITSSSTADVVSITDDSLLANNALIVKGSGVFTGTAASSFVAITPTGGTTGTALYVAMAAATTLSTAVDVTTSTTTGTALRLTTSGVQTGVGSALEIVADAATTPGAVAGEGVVKISVDGLTTGTGLDVTSTSASLAAGEIANFEHIASSGTLVAKTGQLIDVTSSRTNTAVAGTVADDYDALSIIRTSIQNGAGGTLTATGAILYLGNVATQTAGTLTDTVNGLEILMDADGTGNGVKITHPAITGTALNIIASATTSGGGALITANGLTTGIGVSLVHTTSVITTGSVLRVSSTSVDTGTGQGTLLDLVSSGSTAGLVVSLVADAIVGGTGLLASFDGLTTGVGFSLTHTTSAIASGGSVLRVSSTGIDTGTTTGNVLDLSSTASTAGTQMLLTASGLQTGIAESIAVAALTSGTGLLISATAATLTTGFYFRAYDGTNNVFAIKLGGHLASAGTAPTAAAGAGAGTTPTGPAVTAGSTDTKGNVTVTIGTPTGTGIIMTVTFAKAYASAPAVFLVPADAATAAEMVTSKIQTDSTTTTFTIVSTSTGLTQATAFSWNYFCIE